MILLFLQSYTSIFSPFQNSSLACFFIPLWLFRFFFWRSRDSPEIAKDIDFGRTIGVKFDGINMFEWSKLVEPTLVGKELGDHLKESLVLEKDP